jgi:hypothetical protein
VRVRRAITAETGFREAIGGISASTGTLLVSSYDALTMAAQFEDEPLPAKQEQHQLLEVVAGPYRVRVVQTYDPRGDQPSEGAPHFLIELESGSCDPWKTLAWHPA